MKDKLKALVVEGVGKEIGRDCRKWALVCMTELRSGGRHVVGMMVATSAEDLLELADKEGVPIITEKFLKNKVRLKRMFGEEKC